MDLRKDEIFLICTKLSLSNLLNFSLSCKYVFSVFESRIWLYKLRKDYPEFEKCEFSGYKELYRDLYKIEDEDVYEIHTLSRPKYIEDEKLLMNNIRRLLFIYDRFKKKEKRAHYIYLLFAWLDKNVWFLKKQEKFRLTTQQKLRDLTKEEVAKNIIRDFSHLLKI